MWRKIQQSFLLSYSRKALVQFGIPLGGCCLYQSNYIIKSGLPSVQEQTPVNITVKQLRSQFEKACSGLIRKETKCNTPQLPLLVDQAWQETKPHTSTHSLTPLQQSLGGNPKVKVQIHVGCGKDGLIAKATYASNAIKIADAQLCHFQESRTLSCVKLTWKDKYRNSPPPFPPSFSSFFYQPFWHMILVAWSQLSLLCLLTNSQKHNVTERFRQKETFKNNLGQSCFHGQGYLSL